MRRRGRLILIGILSFFFSLFCYLHVEYSESISVKKITFYWSPRRTIPVLYLPRNASDCFSKHCSKSLGTWDHVILEHLYDNFGYFNADTSSNSPSYVWFPFHAYCLFQQRDCHLARAPPTWSLGPNQSMPLKGHLQRQLGAYAKAVHFEALNPNKTTVLVPMAHDYGACARFSFTPDNSFQRAPLFHHKNIRVVTPLGDVDSPCHHPSDLIVPCYSLHTLEIHSICKIPLDASLQRTKHVFFAGTSQFTQRAPGLRPRLFRLFEQDNNSLLLDTTKTKALNTTSYLTHLLTSQFCLVPPGVVGWSARAWEALYCGCIPVFLIHPSQPMRLPFERQLPFAEFALFWPWNQIDALPMYLKSFTQQDRETRQRVAMKYRHFFVWNNPGPFEALIKELDF